jgi:hypothetical protein
MLAPSGHVIDDIKPTTTTTIRQQKAYRMDSQSSALTHEGKLGDHPVKILIDSGATSNFVSQQWVERHQVKLLQVASGGPQVELADGRIHHCSSVLKRQTCLIGEHTSKVNAYVFPLKTFDLILGMPWLQSEQPSIDWKKREISFTSPGSVIKVAQSSSGREELSHLTDLFPDVHSVEYAYTLMESIGDERTSPKDSITIAPPPGLERASPTVTSQEEGCDMTGHESSMRWWARSLTGQSCLRVRSESKSLALWSFPPSLCNILLLILLLHIITVFTCYNLVTTAGLKRNG